MSDLIVNAGLPPQRRGLGSSLEHGSLQSESAYWQQVFDAAMATGDAPSSEHGPEAQHLERQDRAAAGREALAMVVPLRSQPAHSPGSAPLLSGTLSAGAEALARLPRPPVSAWMPDVVAQSAQVGPVPRHRIVGEPSAMIAAQPTDGQAPISHQDAAGLSVHAHVDEDGQIHLVVRQAANAPAPLTLARLVQFLEQSPLERVSWSSVGTVTINGKLVHQKVASEPAAHPHIIDFFG